MKRVLLYVLVLAAVIASWAVFAQERKVRTAAAPVQSEALMESQAATSAGR